MTRGTTNYAVDTGTANTYLVALPHTPSGYVDGLRVTFRALNTNTGASTINVSSLGVKSIRLTSGAALAAGDITVGAPLEIFYSTATGFFHLAPNSNTAATAAATSASNASTSASNASTSASNAATSETNAAASASTATTQASTATTQASNAATSASNASTSASNASTSASTATTQASNASTSASTATTQASNASTSASNASTSASNAATSASNAATSEINAAASYDSFDDRYLGAKAVAPTLDNDGNALLTGALYWDTALVLLRVYNGSSWVNTPATAASGITNTAAGNIVATNVQAAIDELDTEKAKLTTNTFTGAQIYSDQQCSRAMFIDCGMMFLDKGNSGTTTQDLAYTGGSHQKITATGNFTITTSAWPSTGNLGELLLELANGGAYTVTFPSWLWIKPDGTTTTSIATYLAANTGRTSLASSGTDFIFLWSRDGGGSNIYAKLV